MLSSAINKRLLRVCFQQQQAPIIMMMHQVRYFSAAAAPSGAAKQQPNLNEMSISDLHKLGLQNLLQTKLFDYAAIAQPNIHGVTNKRNSFGSFEDDINSQFNL
jgi:hypothetical protein